VHLPVLATAAPGAALSDLDVRSATADDAPALAGMCDRAFSADQILTLVFRDEGTRAQRLEDMFVGAVEFFLQYDASFTTTEVAGAAMWAPPGAFPTDEPPPEYTFPADETERLLTFLAMKDEHHPKVDHWYLGILGADLDRQGRGIGSACMRPILERCDREGVPAYLESTNARNVPLYERHGFWVTEVVDLPEGPPVWLMWREPVTKRP
jgi:GNAT superfamily N-acetyltransferase